MNLRQNRTATVLFLALWLVARSAYSQSQQPKNAENTATPKPKLSGELRITASPAIPESLGDRHLGAVRGFDQRIILNDGRGNRLLDIDAGWRKNPSASKDILLPERSHIVAGFVLPIGKNIRFKQVVNRLWVDSSFGTDYTATGSYLVASRGRSVWKFGYERDSKSTTLEYGTGAYRIRPNVLVAGGISFTQTESGTAGRGVLRQGAGISWTLSNAENHQLMAGIVGAFHASQRPTYIGGIGKCANRKAVGLDPNYLAIYRNRAESQYALGLVTLSGKSLQCSVNESIFSAFLEGGLGPVRIVNNRNFDTLGVGGSYRTQEYGKAALVVSLGRIRITPSVNRAFIDAEFYYTFDKKDGVLFDPYVGVGYSGGEDVFFDTAAARPGLTSRYSDSVRISTGAKFRLLGRTMRLALTPLVDLRTGKPGGIIEISTHF